MLFRPLPYRDADRLVTIFEENPSRGAANSPPTPFNYASWRERVDAFERTSVFLRVQFNVSSSTSALQVEGFRVDASFLIVGQAMVLTAIGVAIGIVATPLSLRLVRGLLFGVGPFDPWTLGAVALALALVSGTAAAIPAYRASRNGASVGLRLTR